MPDQRKEPGDALAWSAADWNAWAATAASAGGAAAGHGVGGPIGSSGGVLRDHTPRSAWARLAGTGSPYDWQEVVRDVAAGTWADGPGSGTASAVEINGVAGLAGTIQRVTECGPGEWCFQAVRVGGCTITIRVHVGTCDAYGALATPTAGATVTARLAGQPDVVGTTDATGLATLTLHAAGTWSVTAAATGYATTTATATVACGDIVDLTVCMVGNITINVTVRPCYGTYGAGVVVDLYDGATLVASSTTNSSGIATFHPHVATTYTATARAPAGSRFLDASGTVGTAYNTTYNTTIVLVAQAPYHCAGDCADPIARTLHLVDPVFGAVTLAWVDGMSVPTWDGSATRSEANTRDATCTTAASRTVRINFRLQILGPPSAYYNLSISKVYCTSGGQNYSVVDGAAGSGTATVTLTAPNPTPCSPPTLSFSGVLTQGPFFVNVLQQTYGSGTQTFTISE